MELEKLPDLLTISQASKTLNVHPNTLRNWDKKGIIGVIRLGKRNDRRFKKEDILKIIKKEQL